MIARQALVLLPGGPLCVSVATTHWPSDGGVELPAAAARALAMLAPGR
jgi:hypothetical protein